MITISEDKLILCIAILGRFREGQKPRQIAKSLRMGKERVSELLNFIRMFYPVERRRFPRQTVTSKNKNLK